MCLDHGDAAPKTLSDTMEDLSVTMFTLTLYNGVVTKRKDGCQHEKNHE